MSRRTQKTAPCLTCIRRSQRPEETRGIEKRYAEGIAWGEMKQTLFDYINDHIKPARDEYDKLIADPAIVEAKLVRGAERAREIAVPFLDEIRDAIGIRKLGA